MQLIINKFDGSIAFVVAPKDAQISLEYKRNGEPYSLHQIINGKHADTLDLPSGNCAILFKGSEAKDSDFEKVIHKQKNTAYPYILYQKSHMTKSAKESYDTLLEAHGITPTPEQEVIVLRRVGE